jgi:hypothetical protein
MASRVASKGDRPMTTPDESKERATEALQRATEMRERGVKIAARWRQSQQDNNFRQMLRQIGKGIARNAPS